MMLIYEKRKDICRYRDKTLRTIKRKKKVLIQPCQKSDVDICGVHCISSGAASGRDVEKKGAKTNICEIDVPLPF